MTSTGPDEDDATAASHVPVLLDRVIELLSPAVAAVEATDTQAVLVDTTLGLGGHAEAMLEAFPDAIVIGIDRDPEALARAGARLARFGDRFTAAHATYDEIADVVEAAGHRRVAGVLFDLGVSSMQLDLAERGFAYSQDAPLDMRMNPEDPLTAAEVLNTWSAPDLARVLRDYGEEKFAKRIADAVVSARESAPLTSSAALVDLVRGAIPAAARRTGGNPAKRTFQALRIAVNDELGVLERALPASLDVLAVDGRVVVLAYHSLEDRMVKRAFTRVTRSTAPRHLPVVPPELQPRFREVVRGSEQASATEIDLNRRAQSVRLRAVERVAA